MNDTAPQQGDVIGQRYRLDESVTRSADATTWKAFDTWLEEPVVLVTPQRAAAERFEQLATTVIAPASSHLVSLYDVGHQRIPFVVLPTSGTLADAWTAATDEDVLVAGRSLGDALAALHQQGLTHGDIHPGAVARGDDGQLALSPWPLAQAPEGWAGSAAADEDTGHETATEADDVHALGALLLAGATTPRATVVAERALSPVAEGGYASAAALRDDCAALVGPDPNGVIVDDARGFAPTGAGPDGAGAAAGGAAAMAAAAASVGPASSPGANVLGDRPEGRRTAVAVGVVVALLAGVSATGVLAGPPALHEVAAADPSFCEALEACHETPAPPQTPAPASAAVAPKPQVAEPAPTVRSTTPAPTPSRVGSGVPLPTVVPVAPSRGSGPTTAASSFRASSEKTTADSTTTTTSTTPTTSTTSPSTTRTRRTPGTSTTTTSAPSTTTTTQPASSTTTTTTQPPTTTTTTTTQPPATTTTTTQPPASTTTTTTTPPSTTKTASATSGTRPAGSTTTTTKPSAATTSTEPTSTRRSQAQHVNASHNGSSRGSARS